MTWSLARTAAGEAAFAKVRAARRLVACSHGYPAATSPGPVSHDPQKPCFYPPSSGGLPTRMTKGGTHTEYTSFAEPTMISVLISARAESALASVSIDVFIVLSDRAGKNNRRRSGLEASQQRESVMDAARPRGRGGVIKRDHEIRGCRRREPVFHQGPGFAIVGQGNRAEIMSQGRANPRRRRLQRRYPRANRDVDVAPVRFAIFDCLENGRRHREYARIAAGDEGDMASILDQAQRMARALHLDPIAGLMPCLPLGRKPFEIGA